MIKLSIKQLSAIRALAASRSFTLAAQTLHTTQSNLSMIIREAEAILGVRLFDRTTKRVSPTAAGEAFAQSIDRALGDLDANIQDLQAQGKLSRGTLSIGVTPLLSSTLVAQAVARFRDRHPEIVIRLEDAVTHRLVMLLTHREIELAIGTFEGRAAEIYMQPLFDDRLVTLSHPSVGLGACVTWADLADKPLIGIGENSSVGKLIDHAFWSVKKRMVRPAIASHHWLTVIALTSYLKGICIVPRYACAPQLINDLVVSALVDPIVSRTVSLASMKGRSLSAAAQAFAHILAQTLQSTQSLALRSESSKNLITTSH